ncbi:ankyrin repeat domain-containing protein [Kistimonas asteriae]|uniref:ankyrin repeat domain-containing protein n=1 Tax=Kistimonas asteriae TaxID=517724 RepID=UPI001BA8D01E|nr:ankyrin repeat domain-containing protein [Kistimonas asteriae]
METVKGWFFKSSPQASTQEAQTQEMTLTTGVPVSKPQTSQGSEQTTLLTTTEASKDAPEASTPKTASTSLFDRLKSSLQTAEPAPHTQEEATPLTPEASTSKEGEAQPPSQPEPTQTTFQKVQGMVQKLMPTTTSTEETEEAVSDQPQASTAAKGESHATQPKISGEELSQSLQVYRTSPSEDQKQLILNQIQDVDNIDWQNQAKESALSTAIAIQDMEMINAILKRQPKMNLNYKDGRTIMHLAVLSGKQDIVEAVLSAAPKHQLSTSHTKSINRVDGLGQTALSLACLNEHTDCITLLMQHGAKAEIIAKDGNTVLQIAVIGGCNHALSTMLEQGASPSATNKKHMTALHSAALMGQSSCVATLLDHIEAGTKQAQAVNQKDDIKQTVLHKACMSGNLETVKKVLDTEATMDAQDSRGMTPLHCAAASKPPRANTAIVQELLNRGADSQKRDSKDMTPLELATQKGTAESVQILLKHVKPEPTCLTQLLIKACELCRPDTVEVILQCGASPDDISEEGYTALIMACIKGNMDSIKHLLNHSASIRGQDRNKQLPLVAACQLQKNPEETIKLFAKKDAKVINEGNQNATGFTPLVAVLISNKVRDRLAATQLLLNKGAKANQPVTGCAQQTPMHFAARKGYGDILSLMLKNKRNRDDLSLKDARGYTPLMYARQNGHTEVIRLLTQ